ncbi:hypothetical protein RhiirB3_459617 [Rhizophagus irregularis]|nr:hypothetical protein RhiirB3_459617 [Rhizophagus irregularis]
MSHLENYYKYYSLSGVPARILKGEEHYNLYKKPLKEKSSERPKVIVWKPNATHQADLAEMPVDPKGFPEHWKRMLFPLTLAWNNPYKA